MTGAAYPRYSSGNQREESIDAQMRAIQDYADRKGITIVKVYPEEAKSATTDQRPQFQQMMRDAERGLFDVIIVHKLDRFARDRYDSAFYKRKLKKCGVRLLSVLENLDDSPEGVIMESVLEGMSEYYSRNLAREVMKGMKENALKGKHTGGKPALGYNVDKEGSYIINQREAEAVKLIFEMKAAGTGYGAILDELNKKGYKTKKGNKFVKNSLHDLLKNEKYIGNYIFNKATAKDTDRKRNNHTQKDESEIIRIENGCPAIISMDLWERVQRIMEKDAKSRASNKAKEPYMLTGLIYCGKCGGAMVGNRSRSGEKAYKYYECSTRKRARSCDKKPVGKEYIEGEVITALYTRLFAPDAVEKMADYITEEAHKRDSSVGDHIKELDRQLREVVGMISKTLDAIADGLYNPSMKERMNEYEATKSDLQIRIDEAKLQQSIGSLSREQIRNYLSQYEGVREMSPEKQREVVRTFVKKITVYDDHADINIFMDGGKSYRVNNLDSAGTAPPPP